MDLISHLFFALLLYQRFDIWLFIGAVIPDIDKIYTYPKKRFRGAGSHTALGELPFGAILLLASASLSIFYPFLTSLTFGMLTHMLLDFITGETGPFRPFATERVDFNWPIKAKIIIGIFLWGAGLAFYGGEIWSFAKSVIQ